MILICYDGSPDAKAAIERGARLLKDEPATVLTVWRPLVNIVAHTPGFAFGAAALDSDTIDDESRKAAEEQANEGVVLASGLGIQAEARVVSEGIKTFADTILAEAEALDASAILMGSRGLTGLKSMLLGSVSHAVIQHADRPVIVVPSPEVAASRARQLQTEQRTEG